MSEIKFASVAVKRDTTLVRLQRIGRFGQTYDEIISSLLDKCEQDILEQNAEEALMVSQR